MLRHDPDRVSHCPPPTYASFIRLQPYTYNRSAKEA